MRPPTEIEERFQAVYQAMPCSLCYSADAADKKVYIERDYLGGIAAWIVECKCHNVSTYQSAKFTGVLQHMSAESTSDQST